MDKVLTLHMTLCRQVPAVTSLKRNTNHDSAVENILYVTGAVAHRYREKSFPDKNLGWNLALSCKIMQDLLKDWHDFARS